MNKNFKFLIGLACVSLGLTACKEDYFDQEKYDKLLQQAFPVDNVDPNHTWAVYGSATANIEIGGANGQKYYVAVYQDNPLTTTPAVLLSCANMVSGTPATLRFSYKLATPMVYVACFDENNRRVIQPMTMENGQAVDINFFGKSTNGTARRNTPLWGPSSRAKKTFTRAGASYDLFSSSEGTDVNDWNYNIPITDEQKALFVEGNYLGFDYEVSYDCEVTVKAGNTEKAKVTFKSGTNNAELKLTADQANSLKSDGLFLHIYNVKLKRVYIREADGSETGGGGSETGGGSTTPTQMEEADYVKASETMITANDWVNPSWRSSKVTVNLNTIDTSNEFNTLNQNAINNNQVANDNRDKKWWRVEGDVTLNQNLNGDQNTLNKAVVYVKSGTLTLTSDYTGVTFIVGDGATLALSGERRFGQAARIIVLSGGTLTADSPVALNGKAESVGFYNAGTATFAASLDLANGGTYEAGAVLYNVGTMTVGTLTSARYLYNYGDLTITNDFTVDLNSDSPMLNYNFYNQGTMNVANATISNAVNYGTLNGTSLNISDNYYFNAGFSEFKTVKVKQLANTGHLTFEENIDTNNERWTLSSCYLHIKKSQTATTGFRRLYMLRNSRIDLDGDMYFQENNDSHMEDKSLLNVGGKFVVPNDGANMYAPTGDGEFAIIKIAGNIEMTKWNAMTRPNDGTLYLDWAHADDGVNHATIANKENYSAADAVARMEETMAKALISESTAPANISIPKAETDDDCTGDGYNTTNTHIDIIPETGTSYRFCFEDFFPHPGDYDFNDCVITVTPTVTDNVATLVMSLDAVGATKQIAAAMRVKGLNPTSVTNATNNFTDYAAQYASMRLIDPVEENGTGLFYVPADHLGKDANGNQINDLVVSLFNDAHWVMSGANAGGNNRDMHRFFYNTVDPTIDYPTAKIADPVTMRLTITCSSNEEAQLFNDVTNLDVFIVEMYDGRTWEVHTYPFKFDQVLKKWADYDVKLIPYANSTTKNYPWAIQVPGDFLYPIEFQSISGSKIQASDTDNYGNATAAYPLFKQWAISPNTTDADVQQWYLRSNIEDMKLVWRKP